MPQTWRKYPMGKIMSKNAIFFSKVMHNRLTPKEHGFSYNVYYLHLPLSKLNELNKLKKLKYNKRGLLSFWEKDHGARELTGLESWARGLLKAHNMYKADGEIIMLALPRVLGYVFNPVSFYFCFDKAGGLRNVIAEVNNTFGETHSYICTNKNQEIISKDDWMESEKLFHVSPFLEREGIYKFRFDYSADKIGIWIDLYDPSQQKKLITSLMGKLATIDDKVIAHAFWKHPLVTLKTIFLIHLHAFKLFRKGMKYIVKPEQKSVRVTISAYSENK
jgi:DUF1365 family protein